MIFSVLGSKGLAGSLGKKGTVSDVALYNTINSGQLFSFVEPVLYPDKLASMLVAAAMSDFSIVHVSPEVMNYQLGEAIIVLNYLKKEGFFVLDGVVEEQVKPLVKGSALGDYDFVEKENAKVWEKVLSFNIDERQGPVKVLVDHSFQVKGVGTVVLGSVRQGVVRKYDKLFAYPSSKEVLVKSIQVNDVEVQEAGTGSRVGLALKGVSVEEVPRGTIITEQGAVDVVDELKIKFEKNPFFKDEVPRNMMTSVGLQNVSCVFEEDKLFFNKKIVFNNDVVILFEPSRKIRIVGGGWVEV